MNNKLTFIFLLSFNFLFIETVTGQNALDSTFRRLFKNISGYYGNVYLDTSYLKADTSQLRKMYPTELTKELELIKTHKMRLTNFSFYDMNQLSFKFRTVKEFYKDRNYKMDLSAEDSAVLVNEQSFHNNKLNYIMNEKVYDSLQKIETLLIMSTFDQIFRDRNAKIQPKHMTLISIFETDKMYLFIYHFMKLQGYPHYYVQSDLVLK